MVKGHPTRGFVVVVAVLLLAGCGGGSSSSSSSQSSFKASYEQITGQLKQISHSIGVDIENASSQSDSQLGAQFSSLASRWQAQVNKLNTLHPPANVATDFHTLQGAITHVEGDLKGIVAAASSHSSAAAKQATESLIKDILVARPASTAITNKLKNQ